MLYQLLLDSLETTYVASPRTAPACDTSSSPSPVQRRASDSSSSCWPRTACGAAALCVRARALEGLIGSKNLLKPSDRSRSLYAYVHMDYERFTNVASGPKDFVIPRASSNSSKDTCSVMRSAVFLGPDDFPPPERAERSTLLCRISLVTRNYEVRDPRQRRLRFRSEHRGRRRYQAAPVAHLAAVEISFAEPLRQGSSSPGFPSRRPRL